MIITALFAAAVPRVALSFLGLLSLLACRALHLVAAAFLLELLVIDLMHLDLDPYFVHIVEPKLGIEGNSSPYQNFVEAHALSAADLASVLTPAPVASSFLGLAFSPSAWGVRLVVAVVLPLLNPPLGPSARPSDRL